MRSLEPKYYTPSIEEFHVGFEYEKRNMKLQEFEPQDILSLGLKLVHEIDDNGETTFKRPDNPDWWLSLDGSRVEIGDIDGLIFCGFVKNKSELKTILKQVGYEVE